MLDNENYRNKCAELVQILHRKNQEIDVLKSRNNSTFIPDCPALTAIDILRNTLVTAAGNAAVYHKPKITSRKQDYIEICTRNFYDLTQDELEGRRFDMESYKETLRTLNLVDAASFINGGIPSRIDGRTVRVVRIPEAVYKLLAGGGS